MQMLMDARGAAAMSGTTYDDDNRHMGDPPPFGANAEFEADVQCALTNTAPVLITAAPDLATAIARRIHRNSLNRRGPFLTLDCGRLNLPEQLDAAFESAAPTGTVFLRDVDKLAPALQAELYSRIVPLGVRVIAATSVSLLLAAAHGKFEERLFYRLNQIHLVAPLVNSPAGAA
jgi:transcriptional regulator of acetoin/glycerol metabolism